ncbi:MAG TPA: recombinase family protein [Symbiobacteriaceae bacterium]|nr:recombinase family protein [Symbiobacteriaceae bacterium]
MPAALREIRPDRVAIYIRWSTEDQGDGTTLVVQQEGCQHYVLSQGWRVTPSLVFIDDGYSGSTLERPRLQALRKAVLAGDVDCVVVYKLDRLSRSVMDTVNLVLGEWDGRTHLKSAREPVDTTSPMGKQFFYMLVSYAEWERNVIKDRTFSGKLRRAKEGKNPGIPASYGYRRAEEVGRFEVDPKKAKVVRWIFRKYLDEWGAFKIADELNRTGVPSPTGLTWHKTTIIQMLKNPIYCGRLVYGRTTTNPRRQRDKSEPVYLKNPEPVVAEAPCPPLVSLSEWERAQALMSQRHRGATGVRSLASEYLLTGFLKCRCGANMASHCSSHRSGKLYFYYQCQGKENHGTHACDCGMTAMDVLDSAVEAKLQEFLQGEQSFQKLLAVRQQKLLRQLNDLESQHRQATTTLEDLEAQMRRLNRDYRTGVLSAASYEENKREVEAERDQLKAQVEELQGRKEAVVRQMREQDYLSSIFASAGHWADLDVPKRKVILRNLLDRVVAFKAPRSREVSIEVVWKFADPSLTA